MSLRRLLPALVLLLAALAPSAATTAESAVTPPSTTVPAVPPLPSLPPVAVPPVPPVVGDAVARLGSRVGLGDLKAAAPAAGAIRGIATLDRAPTASDTAALRRAGLTVQPLEHLPLALVRGTVRAMEAAVRRGAANDVYPDRRIQLYDRVSADAMGAALPRAKGFTGKGVTVAVIDSGCDASHPDLADHVAHNVKLYSPEYANVPPDSSSTIVVPVETGPYRNSDLGSGHGTHVAGIVAADGHTAPEHIGVAPDAELVCYSIGEVLFTTAVVTAYDHLLDQPNLWNVKVINNSWGNSFQQFDPRHPVAVATRAVADLGVHVFFAAGNSGRGNAEMSLNPFSQAPWVTSVASEDVKHVRSDFSSNGLRYDNSRPVTIGAGGHTAFTGNRIGVYHPDVTAPGSAISSTCDTAGTAVGPCPPGENTTASGTSMASPHAAGAAAVLLQANPALTPDQLRAALQATAAPVKGPDGSTLGLWQTGYGRIDLAAAVDLVRGGGHAKRIAKAQAAADRRVLRSLGHSVSRSDLWTWDAPRAAAAGSDSRTFTADVPRSVTHVKVTLSHPSLAVVGSNGMSYTVTVTDGAGKVLGTTTEAASGAGTASLLVDVRAKDARPGTYRFAVRGERAASDPDTVDSESLLGRVVVLQVAQVRE